MKKLILLSLVFSTNSFAIATHRCGNVELQGGSLSLQDVLQKGLYERVLDSQKNEVCWNDGPGDGTGGYLSIDLKSSSKFRAEIHLMLSSNQVGYVIPHKVNGVEMYCYAVMKVNGKALEAQDSDRRCENVVFYTNIFRSDRVQRLAAFSNQLVQAAKQIENEIDQVPNHVLRENHFGAAGVTLEKLRVILGNEKTTRDIKPQPLSKQGI